MIKRWGWHLPILWGEQWKIKILYFKPGGEISYQRHANRSELWLFVFGRGRFRTNDRVYVSKVGGTAQLVECGMWHQYTAEKRTLVIEIQYGGKCKEDDIERAEK